MNKPSTLGTALAGLTLCVTLSACSLTQEAKHFNGLTTPSGSPATYQVTTNYALHLLFGWKPLLGNASVDRTIGDFTAAARKQGGSRFRVADRSCTAYWIILPPISFVLTPVICEVGGDVFK